MKIKREKIFFEDKKETRTFVAKLWDIFKQRYYSDLSSIPFRCEHGDFIETEILLEQKEVFSHLSIEKKTIEELMFAINKIAPTEAWVKPRKSSEKDCFAPDRLRHVMPKILNRSLQQRVIFQKKFIDEDLEFPPLNFVPTRNIGEPKYMKLTFLLWAAFKLIDRKSYVCMKDVETTYSEEGGVVPARWRGYAQMVARKVTFNDEKNGDYGLIETFLDPKPALPETFDNPLTTESKTEISDTFHATDTEKKMLAILSIHATSRLVSGFKFQKKAMGEAFDIDEWSRHFLDETRESLERDYRSSFKFSLSTKGTEKNPKIQWPRSLIERAGLA